jgi:hypothetical protein
MTSAKEAGRALAARRRKVTVSCARCGKEVSGLRTRRYCSDACRVAAARGRSWVPGEPVTPENVVQTGGRLTDELLAQMDALREQIARRLPLGYFEESSVDIINAARDERTDEL